MFLKFAKLFLKKKSYRFYKFSNTQCQNSKLELIRETLPRFI